MALEPLKISCTSTDCDNDLHCFLQKKKKDAQHVGGPCRDCGADLVKWERVQSRSLRDTEYMFRVQRMELIRHEFWHREFDEDAVLHARRKGRRRLREAVAHRLGKYVGGSKNPREGRQTPFGGSVIFYAQHALACCCRKCMEYWYGIEMGRKLTDEEIEYFTELVMLFLRERFPDLADEPEKIPPRRRRKK